MEKILIIKAKLKNDEIEYAIRKINISPIEIAYLLDYFKNKELNKVLEHEV